MSLALVFCGNTPYVIKLPKYDGLIRIYDEPVLKEFPLCANKRGEPVIVAKVSEVKPDWIPLKESKNLTFDAFYAWQVWKCKYKLLSFAESQENTQLQQLIYKLVGMQEMIWQGLE